jgi:hypothetical protein
VRATGTGEGFYPGNFPAVVPIFGRHDHDHLRGRRGIFQVCLKIGSIFFLLLNRQFRFFVKFRTGARQREEPTGRTNGEYPILNGTLQSQCSVIVPEDSFVAQYSAYGFTGQLGEPKMNRAAQILRLSRLIG